MHRQILIKNRGILINKRCEKFEWTCSQQNAKFDIVVK